MKMSAANTFNDEGPIDAWALSSCGVELAVVDVALIDGRGNR